MSGYWGFQGRSEGELKQKIGFMRQLTYEYDTTMFAIGIISVPSP